MEELLGYWTVRDLMCPEGCIFLLEALLEVYLAGAGASKDMLWD